MKKYGKLIVAAAVLLCGMIFTGCDFGKEEMAPEDKWLTKEVEYKKDNSSVSAKATVYLYYTNKDEPEVSGLTSGIQLKKGLNIFFVPDEPEIGETASVLYSTLKDSLNNGKEPYAYFNLPKGSAVNDPDNSGDSYSITMSDELWATFCLLNPIARSKASNENPYPLCHNTFAAVDVSKEAVKNLFSWKQLLIMLLSI